MYTQIHGGQTEQRRQEKRNAFKSLPEQESGSNNLIVLNSNSPDENDLGFGSISIGIGIGSWAAVYKRKVSSAQQLCVHGLERERVSEFGIRPLTRSNRLRGFPRRWNTGAGRHSKYKVAVQLLNEMSCN